MMQNYRPFSGITPAVKTLLAANVLVFFLCSFAERNMHIDTAHLFGLHLPQSPYWGIWQYVTHMFMHGGISHLFFNMFALFMFGRILESVWGNKRFLIFYFVCGIGAGTLNSLVGWFEIHRMMDAYTAFQATPTPSLLADFVRENLSNPADWVWKAIDDWIDNPSSAIYADAGRQLIERIIDLQVNVPMIGASGAVFGILLAFGMLFPNTELFLMFIPIPIKAKYFVLGYGFLEFYLGLQNSAGDHVAHFAHLGGMLFGYILLKIWSRKRNNFY